MIYPIDTLIIVQSAPNYGIVDVELAEFLLAYSAYGSRAHCVFVDSGLQFLQAGESQIPGLAPPSQMLTALSYGHLSYDGLWTSTEPCHFTPTLPLTWITAETLHQMQQSAKHCLFY